MNFFKDIIEIQNYRDACLLGMNDELFSLYINKIFNDKNENILIVTSNLYEANAFFDKIRVYTEDVYLFPMDDFLSSVSLALSPDLLITRLTTLNAIINSKKCVVITDLNGYLRFLPNKKLYMDSILKLKVGLTFSFEEFISKIASLGYNRQTLVTQTGEFGVRGFVVDIFPIGYVHPIRFEFFGDELDSIRSFDEKTQSSLSNLKDVCIYPFTEFLIENGVDSLEEKFKFLNNINNVNIEKYLDNCLTVFINYNSLEKIYLNLESEIFDYDSSNDKKSNCKYMNDFYDLTRNRSNYLFYMPLDNLNEGVNCKYKYDYNVSSVIDFNENIDLINSYISKCVNDRKTVIICLKNYQFNSFLSRITEKYFITDFENIKSESVNIVDSEINGGFIYNNYVLITGKELFNARSSIKKHNINFKYGAKIRDLNKLSVGDYVVHELYGIGVYNGLKTLNSYSVLKDYIEVLYLNNDKLYIPVESIDSISKFSSAGGSIPKINGLDSNGWNKIKERVREKVKGVALELIDIYAKRKMSKGFKFDVDSNYQKDFESEFEYTPTKDQLVSTEQIKIDMESENPMDRLLCGDVGFGKTEVAFRAIFKAIMNSKQVMYLCPTTILSSQQYKNALERFKNYPIRIALLNRFVSNREVCRVIEEFKLGKIDLLFGTHRILSGDVIPHDLGLLIIDEEQRFGVKHKEAIKKIKANVDVLTLTATPIPRTLQMSLIGIRGLSLIETPPVNRYPVQTYVIEESDLIVKDAIYKELSRNGQVFILYNRVDSIKDKVDYIKFLVPEARICYGHGKMNKDELEDVMVSFIEHKYDILVCTTIIETGIDIPNVNTLIVFNADNFGVSQLYQIRGRVGRSDKIAYAYLMYDKKKILSTDATKRLNAIKEFTELGSGFSIASRDLSIRGAGDLLGNEQAGFINNIGIELYLKILNQEIEKIKLGKDVSEEVIEKDDKPLINVETHIDDNYVSDVNLKLEIHKLINKISSYQDVIEVKRIIEDRFGMINENLKIYMYEEWFDKIAKSNGVTRLNSNEKTIELIFKENAVTSDDIQSMFYNSINLSKNFTFKYINNMLHLYLELSNLNKHYIYYLVDLFNVTFGKKGESDSNE